MPLLPPRLPLLVAALVFVVVFLQLGVLSVAFEKLSLAPESAYLLLVATLAGSAVNLPLFRVRAEPPLDMLPPSLRRMLGAIPGEAGSTIVAVNVGGCIVPVAFSAYLLGHSEVHPFALLLTVAAVTMAAYVTSAPVAGVGIAMPFLVAPVTAALVATMVGPDQRAPLAYIGGTLGVLLGADVLRLGQIGRLGAPVASIGGAGTFDGIFLSGLLAVLLA